MAFPSLERVWSFPIMLIISGTSGPLSSPTSDSRSGIITFPIPRFLASAKSWTTCFKFSGSNPSTPLSVIESSVKIDSTDYPKEYYAAFKQIFDVITQYEGQLVTVVKK